MSTSPFASKVGNRDDRTRGHEQEVFRWLGSGFRQEPFDSDHLYGDQKEQLEVGECCQEKHQEEAGEAQEVGGS
jgi:hypothetical protein